MALSYQQFLATDRYQGLDHLRCLSIVLVVWFHTGNKVSSSEIQILNQGYLGVSLFFVISGFLITSLLLREQSLTGGISFKKFFMRRALRIFPLYYVVIAVYCVAVLVMEKDSAAGRDFWHNLPYFLTYTSNYFVALSDSRVIFYFAWSLAAEEQFYLVWPLLLKFFGVHYATSFLYIGILMLIANIVYGPLDIGAIGAALRGVQLEICFGVSLAVWARYQWLYRQLRFIAGFRFAPYFYSILIAVAVQFNWYVAISVPALMTCLVFSVVISEPNQRPVDSFSLTGFVGKVSYGIYLFHMLCANAIGALASYFEFELSAIAYFSLSMLCSIIVAGISFYTLERYFLNLKFKYRVVN